VLLDEEELAAVRVAARRRRLTVSEYVRFTLREARAAEPAAPVEGKLMAVREAAAHAYPVADMETLNAEIARGYGVETP